MEPKVSIIVPVYNAEKSLARCVDSILNQNCIDAYTDHDKKALESQCKQGA